MKDGVRGGGRTWDGEMAMTEYMFSCRIDGRAGYVRLWADALELIRSGRGAGEPEFVPLDLVTSVATGKPGLLFTPVQLVVDGERHELTFPTADAPRVAELIEALVAEQAPRPATVFAPVTVFAPEPTPVFETYDPYDNYAADAAAEAPEAPEFEMPDFSMPPIEMPEWTPLAESSPDLVVSDQVVDELVAPAGSDAASIPAQVDPSAEFPVDLESRLARLEVLRSCGIMSEADFADAEAQLLEATGPEARTA